MLQGIKNHVFITIVLIFSGVPLLANSNDHEHFTGTYAYKSTPYWPKFQVLHTSDGYMLTIPGDSKWKVSLKPSGQSLVGQDGVVFDLSYDNANKCYNIKLLHSNSERSFEKTQQMLKVIENPSKELEKKYGVKAADLVRNVRKSEEWIHQVKSMKIIAKDKWIRTPEGIEHIKKGLKERYPDADLSSRLWSEQQGKVEAFFDNQRYGYRNYANDKKDALWIWNGKEILGRVKDLNNNSQQYVIRKDKEGYGNVLEEFMWPRSRHHEYYWQKEIVSDTVDWYGRPKDFILVGVEKYKGTECYVLESFPKKYRRVRRWFIGVGDGLRYGEMSIESGEVSRQSWTSNYKEVKKGWWFPIEQGYHNYERDQNSKSFIAAIRNIHVEDVPRSTSLCQINFLQLISKMA